MASATRDEMARDDGAQPDWNESNLCKLTRRTQSFYNSLSFA